MNRPRNFHWIEEVDARMKTSQEGIDLIKRFEGLRLDAYQDAVGVWTIGYGSTRGVKPGMSITKEEAEALLLKDLERFERAVNDHVHVPISQSQFDALVSFAFNVGTGALQRSTLLRMLNRYNYDRAAQEFHRWNMAGGKVLSGLSRRRAEESKLFKKEWV